MVLDLFTIIFILGIVHTIQFFALFQQYIFNKNYQGIGWWLSACVAAVLSFVFMVLRSIPSLLTLCILFQNVFVFLAFIFIYIGIVRFFDKKANLKIISFIFIMAVSAILYFRLVEDNMQIRSLVFALVVSSFSFLGAHALYKNRMDSIKASFYFLFGVFSVNGVLFLYRAILIFTGKTVELNSTEFFNLVPYLESIAFGLLWTFGFILMVNQRLISEMKEAKDHFESIFNTSPNPVLINRLNDGYVMDVNPAFTQLLGFSREECLSKTTQDLNLWYSDEAREKITSDVLVKKVITDFEVYLRKKDGTGIFALMSSKVISLHGTPHIISTLQDISHRKEAELKLRQYSDELKLANETKNKFFSIIAHDLRSPFHAFLGLSGLLAENTDSLSREEIKNYASALNAALKNQFDLLNDLLDWAKLQNKDFMLNVKSVNLNDLVKSVLDPLSLSAKHKEILLRNNISPNLFLSSDGNMIKLLIRNLISNSIKFTNKNGFVEISALKKAGFIEITVADNGVGIPEDEIQKLLKEDGIHSTEGTGSEKGTGLGLLLCREIVKKHGGKIWVESELGKGTKFVFTIPNN